MRLCRVEHQGTSVAAFYSEDCVTPFTVAAAAYAEATGTNLELPDEDDLLALLPGGPQAETATTLANWLSEQPESNAPSGLATADVKLLVPNPEPNKLFLLAGNYAAHIEEGGGIAAERAETFPYVFMKPPTTTLTNPGAPVQIPSVSPDSIDWELELGVIIGKGGKHITETDALNHVAGYTVINDISDRKFRPNPNRKERSKDSFFDWLHGKWHDTGCPCGPCITSAAAISDPQSLELQLTLNDEIRQDASTAQQIFPVAAVIEFISSFVTLEPGDMISTGTPSGVGSTTGTFVKPGDVLEATISSIGTLRSPLIAE